MDNQQRKPIPPILISEPADLEKIEMMTTSTFSVIGSTPDIPDAIFEKLAPILTKLKTEKGYKFNYANDEKDVLGKFVFNRYSLFTDVYLPWKNFNGQALKVDDEVITPVIINGADKAHKIAARLKFKKDRDDQGNLRYNLLPEAAKKFSARDVHLLTGANCSQKVKFIILYSTDNAEIPTDIVDYNVTGAAAFPIRIANAFNITVFNIHKPERLNDLIEFVNKL